MKTPFRKIFWALAALLLGSAAGYAQQQQTGLCSEVKMVINQQLTIERVGFQATLTLTDNDSTDPLTDFAANISFSNPALTTNSVPNDASSLFFVQPPTLQNISAIDGTGTIGPGQTATITWFIIPTISAGGSNANGTIYQVSANLSAKIRGTVIPAPTLQVFPAPITVKPDAQLQITYFQPRDVIGIDPITYQGSPIPFTFGVLVQNVGYGLAHNVIIQSQQPKIVENRQNLLLVAQLLGSRVNDSALSNANLTVNLGDLQPGSAAKGAWDMIVSLSGTFISVAATYTHSSALGGSETSLIKSVNAYLFAHEVLDDQPGRDNIRDFLADTAGNLAPSAALIPDSLYESEGGVYPVNYMTNTTVGSGNPLPVTLTANFSGWGFIRVNDPGQAKIPIGSVVRNDGKVLNTNNFWTNVHYEPGTDFKDTYLNIFDFVNNGASYTYTVTYTNTPPDTNPPVTSVQFAGSATFTNGIYYVTPQTQIYFLGQDASPVTIYDSLDGSAFGIAFPFNLINPGTYQLSFHGLDANNNQETNHNVTLVVAGSSSLGFLSSSVPSAPIVNPGGALSVRPGSAAISFQAAPNPNAINAQVDIFQGAHSWATISNTPSSPTSSGTASLKIGGQNVDDYIYRLNGGSWSSEFSASSNLALSGLAPGSYTVSVLGRPQFGTYLDPTNAVSTQWIVDSAAPPTTVSGAPATPTTATGAELTVGGAGVHNYRWTINRGYFRAPAPVSAPLLLSNLTAQAQVVNVIGDAGGSYQPTNNPTTVSWTIDPLYGYDFSSMPEVRSVAFTNVGSSPITFNWNGVSDLGVIEPSGWYTIRLTLTDSLGNTNFTVGLAQVGSLAGSNNVLASFNRGPQNPRARGNWVVWQDQSDGNWEIYAQNIVTNSPIAKLTHTPLTQQNPNLDGRYVVWQGQQANGNWDVYLKDLSDANPPVALTSSPAVDEVNPAMDWPWVVYQTRATGNTNAPWQLFATNLLNGESFAVSPSGWDELDPDVQASRVVWQDWRDAGPGEIYFCDLETRQVRRITTNSFGQYHPVIYDNWIAWEDNRHTEVDIYGFDLVRNKEVRVTSTPEDELRPRLNGPWLICAQNALGPNTGNGKLIHLPSLISVPVSGTPTLKSFPALAEGLAIWQETITNQSRIVSVALPSLQPVFQNRNVVPVTPAMAGNAVDAYGLLGLWATNGVQSVTAYTSLVPQITSQTATYVSNAFSGPNFNLTPGAFLWMSFKGDQTLDLGLNNNSPMNLTAGVNVISFPHFPDAYSAFQLLRQLGLSHAQSVRMLDAESGRWRVAQILSGAFVGDDFPIPNVAVLMVSLASPVNNFVPQSQ